MTATADVPVGAFIACPCGGSHLAAILVDLNDSRDASEFEDEPWQDCPCRCCRWACQVIEAGDQGVSSPWRRP